MHFLILPLASIAAGWPFFNAAQRAVPSIPPPPNQPIYPRESIQWPRPASGYVTRSSDWTCLSKSLTPTYEGTPTKNDLAVIEAAVAYLVAELTDHETDCLKGGGTSKSAIGELRVAISTADASLGLDTDESYSLTLHDGELKIAAANVWGARHAVTTLQNMLEVRNFAQESYAATASKLPASDGSHHHVLPYVAFAVSDRPRLRHRGLMIDTSRSYLSLSTMYRTVRTMSRVKMNVLHIHASDDQSFPLLLGARSTPLVHGDTCTPEGATVGGVCKAAYSNHHVYKLSEMRALIDYAKLHGVRVIIEIDQPAHARSWASNDESLRECDQLEHQTDFYCAEPICGPLALSKNWDAVVSLAHKITDDWLELQPDQYMHYGMDEVKSGCWGEQLRDELAMKYLEDAVLYLQGKDPSRRMIAWQDGLVAKLAALPSVATQVTAQVWNDPAVAADLLAKGHDIIWSRYEAMYLDCGRGNPAVATYASWCSPYKTWWAVFKETPDLTLTSELNKGQVLGGEVALWAEQANDEVFDSLLWPRAAAWGGAAWEARNAVLRDPVETEEIEGLLEAEFQLRSFTSMITMDGVAATSPYTEWCVFENKQMCNYYALEYFQAEPEINPSAGDPLLGIGLVSIVALPHLF